MSLKFRLALLYSLSVFIILLLSALSIFFLNENFREEEFSKRLILEATESIQLFSSGPGDTNRIIEFLNQNAANSLPEEKIYIFDSARRLVYASVPIPSPSISKKKFDLAKSRQTYIFTNKDTAYCSIYRQLQGQQYFAFVSAYDHYGLRKGENLKILLFSSVILGLVFSGVLAFFYVRHIMRPLEELKGQMEKIDEKNLKERIALENSNTEVWQIARKFNEMLDRLEHAFEQRKSFVQHASHELRTPLANMLAQTESALTKHLTEDGYRKILISLKEDQQDLIDLTNSLLTLSRYEKISFVSDWSLIRIDEILYDLVDFAELSWPNAIVTVDFETIPESQNELELMGNEFLIKSAIRNLVKNAIQYSENNRVVIRIKAETNGILLHFDNKGKQLTSKEQTNLYVPFFRGENSANKKGYGLGLSIVERIIQVHNGTIRYQSLNDNINRFSIYLPLGK